MTIAYGTLITQLQIIEQLMALHVKANSQEQKDHLNKQITKAIFAIDLDQVY